MPIVDQLRQAIEASGLSHYEIARRAGVAQSVISRLMTGAAPSGPNVDKLCEALGLELRPKGRTRRKGARS